MESKSFSGTLRINRDNSLTVSYAKSSNPTAFPNPIEQNNRHKKVLLEFIDEHITSSVRIKALGGIKIDSKVLIHP